VLALLAAPSAARAYIEVPYTLGRVLQEATSAFTMRVERVDKTRNLIVYSKVQDLKGVSTTVTINHSIGLAEGRPGESQNVMSWAEPGKLAVCFQNGGASETCIDNYWYQCAANGEWWTMNHAEPFFLRTFAGRPEKLATAVSAMALGQEVIVPCMVDGDKSALALRRGKIQRLKASLKLQDYEARRDFVGWGGEDFRAVSGMPGFSHYGALTRVDPRAHGIATADFDGDGKIDLCLTGEGRTALLQNAGSALNEVGLPHAGGACGAAWADFNSDGRPDLLLATPSGPKLLVNQKSTKEGGVAFDDQSAALPLEPYYSLAALAWLDYDGDAKPDILLADRFRGLRLYRNVVPAGPAPLAATPTLGKWKYAGPFDNTGDRGFSTSFPPESGVDLSAQYEGKNGERVVWRERDFTDGQIQSLKLFRNENNDQAVVYLYREIDTPGAVEVPVSLGSDDTLSVWLNGAPLWAENVGRAASPDQARLRLKLKPGKNRLLLKVCQGGGDWAFFFTAGKIEKVVPPAFVDVSEQVGLGKSGIAASQPGDELAVADVNGDGRPDFLLSAAGGVLVLNTPQGFLAAKDSGLKFRAGGVTPVFTDFDGDKLVDLFVPQGAAGLLYRGDGRGHFTDVTAKAGDLAQPLKGAVCGTWTDFNHDGKLDLIVGCVQGPNRYFRNLGGGKFVDAGDEIGLYQRVFNSRALAVVDLNRDGILDLVMNNEGQESAVLLGAKSEQMANAAGVPTAK
jgi:hypothetical protein